MRYIYGLYDPPERGGRLRYIGQAGNPKKRHRDHWNDRVKRGKQYNSLKNKWLRTLDEPPPMEILVIVEDIETFDTENAAIREVSRRWPGLLTNSAHNGNNPEWLAANASRSAKVKAYAARPEVRRRMSETAKRNLAVPGQAVARANIRWSDPAQREGARQRGQDVAGEYSAMMREWWKRSENQLRMMERNVSSATCWANNLCSLDKPCKQCGAPVGVFRIDPPCKVCDRRKRHTFWMNTRTGEWSRRSRANPGMPWLTSRSDGLVS
jgi:hypothetical protein